MRTLSIIIPTFNEAHNIEPLAENIHRVLVGNFSYEVIVVDDASDDGTAERVEALPASYNFSVIRRKNERGLASAVLLGIKKANYSNIVVMDADLSHPPEEIPVFVEKAEREHADIVVGSRYVEGGSTDYSWTIYRRLNTWLATFLILPLVRINDPMAGFFLMKKELIKKDVPLDPIGYKILLELIVKTSPQKICEVPIHFHKRLYGKSKLSFKEQLNYLRHVSRLYRFKLRGLFLKRT